MKKGLNKHNLVNRFLGFFGLRIVAVAQLTALRAGMATHLCPNDYNRILETTDLIYAEKMTRKARPAQILGLMHSQIG